MVAPRGSLRPQRRSHCGFRGRMDGRTATQPRLQLGGVGPRPKHPLGIRRAPKAPPGAGVWPEPGSQSLVMDELPPTPHRAHRRDDAFPPRTCIFFFFSHFYQNRPKTRAVAGCVSHPNNPPDSPGLGTSSEPSPPRPPPAVPQFPPPHFKGFPGSFKPPPPAEARPLSLTQQPPGRAEPGAAGRLRPGPGPGAHRRSPPAPWLCPGRREPPAPLRPPGAQGAAGPEPAPPPPVGPGGNGDGGCGEGGCGEGG